MKNVYKTWAQWLSQSAKQMLALTINIIFQAEISKECLKILNWYSELDNNKSCYVEKDNIWLMKLMKIT